MSRFQTLAQEMLPVIQQEMRGVLHANPPTTAPHLYKMMHYHLGWLDENFQPATIYAGKQIRPLLCLLTCHAAGGEWSRAVPAAAAIELLHNFSLIHDDIEDRSPTRRGRATLWQLWGIPLAINAGDAMFATAHLALNRLMERGVPAPAVVRALRRFDEICLQLTEGQHDDMQFEVRSDVTVDEYLTMIKGKTSVLLGLCTELGALIAGCDDETIAHYGAFGLNLGLAFQVQDDVLGIWGDEALIGKSATSDIETRKKTLPILYGLADSAALRELYQQQQTGADFVRQVVALLDASGAREFAESRAQHYSQEAICHLTAAQPVETTLLEEITAYLLKRQT